MFGFSPIATVILFVLIGSLYFPIRRFTTRLIAVLLSIIAIPAFMLSLFFLFSHGMGYFAPAFLAVGVLLPLAYEIWQRVRG